MAQSGETIVLVLGNFLPQPLHRSEAAGQARRGCWLKSGLAASRQLLMLVHAIVALSRYVERVCTLWPRVAGYPWLLSQGLSAYSSQARGPHATSAAVQPQACHALFTCQLCPGHLPSPWLQLIALKHSDSCCVAILPTLPCLQLCAGHGHQPKGSRQEDPPRLCHLHRRPPDAAGGAPATAPAARECDPLHGNPGVEEASGQPCDRCEAELAS